MKTGKSARRETAADGRESGEWALAQHRAQCRICKHPEREEIEREFLDWTSPREIAATWKMASYRAIYRHAHATGLFERRRKNWRGALERIIERVSEVQVTASAVIAAIRLSARLERERSEAAERQPRQKFVLSLDGLPRTDAVTGRQNPVVQDSACAAHARIAGAGLKPATNNGGGNRMRNGEGTLQRAATGGGQPEATKQERGGGAEDEEAAREQPGMQDRRLKPAPPETQSAPAEKDPRIALGEDGRVAGIPWPWKEKKITFARRPRWRPGYVPGG